MEIDLKNKSKLSAEQAWGYRIVPSKLSEDEYHFYTDEIYCTPLRQDELMILFGKRIHLIAQNSSVIDKALTEHYVQKGESPGNADFKGNLDISDRDFVSSLFEEARALKSSDIHIETYEEKCRIRLRIDGKLVERKQLSKAEYPALINKIKILAGLDISEKRLPQDGRIFFSRGDVKIDVRVSVLPTLYGEKIVLRLLGNNVTDINLDTLGFSDIDLSRYKEAIQKKNGIILISGPTGSGKTTTLYGTLKLLNRDSVNVVTVEDPIEYTLEGVNQVQVKDDIGLTFASALKTFLRQDPNIIMVGEIRDGETASLAIRAALTGHLVLSTIHTNSAWGTISRLLDMNVPAFLLADTLNITVAQRLVRVLCRKCKQKAPFKATNLPPAMRDKALFDEHYLAVGCPECFYTGYSGRKAIYEVIPIDTTTSDFILDHVKHPDDYFRSKGILTLQNSAIAVVRSGETSVEEIYPFLLHDQY